MVNNNHGTVEMLKQLIMRSYVTLTEGPTSGHLAIQLCVLVCKGLGISRL